MSKVPNLDPRKALPPHPQTHEGFIHAVRTAVVPRVSKPEESAAIRDAKLVYGSGPNGTRGVTFYDAWRNGKAHAFVEVTAVGEQGKVQLAGTTIHELGHVLAGHKAGHGAEWKQRCRDLGLTHAEAAGQNYDPAHFDADVWKQIELIQEPTDGKPRFGRGGIDIFGPAGLFKMMAPRPCGMGIGTRGGKSRGVGSGSRLIKATCPKEPCGYVVRITRKWLDDPAYGAPKCPKHNARME